MHTASDSNRLTPLHWGETLAGRPQLDTRIGGAVPALVRRWQGIPPEIDQSSLDEHYLSVHLGGAKRLHRLGEGHRLVRDTQPAAHSFVPAGAAYRWTTEGPVDFMHLYFDQATIDRFVSESFDRDPRGAQLRECLGESEPLIDTLAVAILTELSRGDGVQQAYVDDLMHLILLKVLRCYSDAAFAAMPRRYALAPHRLRIAKEFIESRLGEPIGVGDIAASAGMSAFHFSRAFRLSTGAPPYAYLLDRRIAAAKRQLANPGVSLATIARDCGFNSPSQFSRMFKAAAGVTPSDFRRRL
ncbi:MAG: AraC family transcriptional regulator [Pseudomonadota bacterium]